MLYGILWFNSGLRHIANILVSLYHIIMYFPEIYGGKGFKYYHIKDLNAAHQITCELVVPPSLLPPLRTLHTRAWLCETCVLVTIATSKAVKDVEG